MGVSPRTYTVNGERRVTRTLYVHGHTHTGRQYHIPIGPVRRTAQEADLRISDLVAAARSGTPVSPDAVAWLRRQPASLRRRLIDLQLVPPSTDAASWMLEDHLRAWQQHLTDLKRSPGWVALTVRRARDVIAEAKMLTWEELSADDGPSRIARAVRVLQARKSLSAQEHNHHVAAIKALARHVHHCYPALPNPITPINLPKLEVRDVDRTRQHRPLTDEEFTHLMRVVPGFDRRKGLSGPDRALLYRLCRAVGARSDEIWHATVADLQLDRRPWSVRIVRGKRGKSRVVPLADADLVDALRRHVASMAPGVQPFRFHRRQGAAMLRLDMQQAREEWLLKASTPEERRLRTESTHLLYQSGTSYADFHGFRSMLATDLLRAGVTAEQASKILGHSSPRTTWNHYQRLGQTDAIASMEQLESRRQANRAGA
jgi:integrase